MSACYRTYDDPEMNAEHAALDHEAGIDADYIADLPGPGRHFTYMLFAPIPGVCPYEELATVYVGVTSNLRARMRSHSRKWWWDSILRDCCEFAEWPSREMAERMERRSIQFSNPDLNVSLGVGRKLSSLLAER